MDGTDWTDPNARAIAIYLDGSDDPDRAEDGTPLIDDDFLVLVNSWWEPLGFVLPQTRPGAQWRAEIDSYDPAAPAGAIARSAGDQVTLGPDPSPSCVPHHHDEYGRASWGPPSGSGIGRKDSRRAWADDGRLPRRRAQLVPRPVTFVLLDSSC